MKQLGVNIGIFFSIGLFAFPLTAFADQIVMKNGDKVTGSVVKKDAKTVTFKSENFGVVTLDWEKVANVTIDQPINVVLESGSTVQGTVATSGDKVEVTAAGSKQVVAPAEIVALRDAGEQKNYERYLRPGLLDLWTVGGNVNIAGTSGNARTSSFAIPVNAVRASKTSKTTLYFNFIKSSADIAGVNQTTAQAIRGGLAYSRNLKPRLFVNVFNDYEFDKFQSLDLRAVFGGGLGFALWKSDRGRLDVLGGADYNHEKFDPARPLQPFTRNAAELYWGDDFNYKLSNRMGLIQSYRMFNNLSNTGEFRQNFDISLTAKFTKYFTWNATFSDRYLSLPAAGRLKNDTLYTTGLGFSFSR